MYLLVSAVSEGGKGISKPKERVTQRQREGQRVCVGSPIGRPIVRSHRVDQSYSFERNQIRSGVMEIEEIEIEPEPITRRRLV